MRPKFGLHLGGMATSVQRVRVTMGPVCMRMVAAATAVAALILSVHPSLAQTGEPKAGTQRQAGAEGEGQKKVDDFAEAAKHLPGPAGNPECVSVGRKTLVLLL